MSEVPDVYVDQFQMVTSVWGVTFSFGVRSFPQLGLGSDGEVIETTPEDQVLPLQTVEPKATVRMGHNHAKVMLMLAVKQLKEYEKRYGNINVPQETLQKLNLDSGDW
jgi:hypothetical protein